MGDGGSCLLKAVLVIVNSIFLLAGGLMLALGIVAKVEPGYIAKIISVVPRMDTVPAALDLDGIIQGSAIFMIVLGGVVAIVGFFGCCGAFCGNKCLLKSYVIVLVVVLCGEVALIIYAAVAPAALQNAIQDVMIKSLQRVKEDVTFSGGLLHLPNETSALGWAVLQLETKCCGTYNYSDYSGWKHNVTYNVTVYQASVPVSCCRTTGDVDIGNSKVNFVNVQQCLNGNSAYINDKNCYQSVYGLIQSSTTIAIGIAAGIVVAQLILIIVSICLCKDMES